MPGRCAAPPAAAMMTLIPFDAADEAYSAIQVGVRCADVIRVVKGMLNLVRMARPACRTGRSESEPITTATRGCTFGLTGIGSFWFGLPLSTKSIMGWI